MSATERPRHPELPGHVLGSGEQIADVELRWPVSASERSFDNGFVGVREESVQAPDGAVLERTVVESRGAVCVLAVDDDDRVLFLEQYRHPVGRRLLELPAGLLDVEGESPIDAAARELAEEADLVAGSWERLTSIYPSPGFTDQEIEVYVATDLSAVPDGERTEREQEEADMTSVWVPFDDAVAAVMAGRVTNATAVIGILGEAQRRRDARSPASG